MNENQKTSSDKVSGLYCRVSTLDQISGLESQIRVLKEFCEKNNINNYEFFTDEGISGGKVSRPALDRMMSLVREGKIDRVVVYSFSRFARSVTHLLNALEEFKKMNVSFISYTEKVDTESPMGRAFFVIIAAISQLERELIVERVKNGLKNAKLKGKLIGRKKTRPSELIRQLLKKNLPYRTIASVCNISHGSVWAELVALRKEESAAKLKKQAEEKVLTAGELFPGVNIELQSSNLQQGISSPA